VRALYSVHFSFAIGSAQNLENVSNSVTRTIVIFLVNEVVPATAQSV
jgi:hypothetical protein